MPNYQILSDSGCDLPGEVLQKLGVSIVPLQVNFRGKTLPDSVDSGIKDIYDGLRAGETATTSAVNPQQWGEAMEPTLAQGQDLLVVTFSSGLSATYQSAVIAANELAEKYPSRKIRVVDSLSASLGQGLLLYYTCKKRDEGMELDQLADWVKVNRMNLSHWFTVDDLMYLKRGGRISAATAIVGTMLKIKPVLHMDNEGHLINMSKARGRRASIDALAEKMAQTGLPGENSTVYICHGDCLEDAQYLAEKVKRELGVKEVLIGYTGAVIGSHSGPGTLALFFLATHR